MNFKATFNKILIVLTVLKAAIDIKDEKQLAEFIEYSANIQEEFCQICTETFLTDGIYDINEIKSNPELFLSKHSLILCPSSSKHIFHKKCLVRWFLCKKSCPTCRSSITTDCLKQLVFNKWNEFYSLDQNTQNGLISQLKTSDILNLVKVFKIFKHNFEENKLEDLKRFIPEGRVKKKLVKIIDAYNTISHNDDLLFISENLKNESLDVIKEIFNQEELSNSKPFDLLRICRNLDKHSFSIGFDFESLYKFLNIKKMKKYAKFFSFDYFDKLLSYELDTKNDFYYLRDICARMRPQDSFDEKRVLESIYKHAHLHPYFENDFASYFLECFKNFYGIKEIDFCRRLIVYMIQNREIFNDKGELIDMKPVFEFLFLEMHSNRRFNIIEFLDSIVHSNAATNEQIRDNFVELLLPVFNDVIRKDIFAKKDNNSEELKRESNSHSSPETENENNENVSMETESEEDNEEDDDDDEGEENDETVETDSEDNENVSMETEGEGEEEDYDSMETDSEEEDSADTENEDDEDYRNPSVHFGIDEGTEEEYELLDEEYEDIEDKENKTFKIDYEDILEYVISNHIIGDKFLEEFRKNYDSLNSELKEKSEYYENIMLENTIESLQSLD